MLERMYVPWKPTYIRLPNDIRVIRGVREWLDTPGRADAVGGRDHRREPVRRRQEPKEDSHAEI